LGPVRRRKIWSGSRPYGVRRTGLHAIVLAGGKGRRLAPFTDRTPKALMRIGGRPLLDIIVRQLREAGYRRVTVCISHLGEMIREEIGDGRDLGISVEYCRDVEPLGTAAPLRLVADWDSPALVMNGDILTAMDFAALARAHRGGDAIMTVAAHMHRVPVGFGVIEARDGRVRTIREKPSIPVEISAGIQIVDPRVRRYLPVGAAMDLPGLVGELIGHGQDVGIYRFAEPWHDIGTPQGLRRAADAFSADPHAYLPAGKEALLDIGHPHA
jgi:NDP-mannose synthase